MKRLILMLTVAAVMTAMMAIIAAPAQAAKAVCKTYEAEEWAMLTGDYSEYGGTWCYR